MKILLVDDNKIIRETLCNYLESNLDAKVSIAIHGQEGLSIFETEKFDLIIADINMPVMDGIEMVKEIRLKNNTTKIIGFSMMDDSSSKDKMLDAGANAYIIKEGDVQKIINTINDLMKPA